MYAGLIAPKLTEERAAENLAAHRIRMIQALAESIREKGLAQTQVSDIVARAQASRTTFYRCFDDKSACLAALAELVFTITQERVLMAVDPNARWQDQIDQGIDAFFEIAEMDHALAATFTTELPGLGARGEAIRHAREQQYAEMIVSFASGRRRADREGDFSHVTIERAVMLVSGIEGLLSRAVQQDQDFRALAPTAKDVARRILAPPGSRV